MSDRTCAGCGVAKGDWGFLSKNATMCVPCAGRIAAQERRGLVVRRWTCELCRTKIEWEEEAGGPGARWPDGTPLHKCDPKRLAAIDRAHDAAPLEPGGRVFLKAPPSEIP